MLLRQTFGRLRGISRPLTTGQLETQQLDEEYLSAKSYETIPKVSSLKILWSMMDSKEKTMLDRVIKSHHDTAGSIFKICIPGQTDRVSINQPELLRTLMSKEGKMPVEPGFDPLVYYRNVIRKQTGSLQVRDSHVADTVHGSPILSLCHKNTAKNKKCSYSRGHLVTGCLELTSATS